MRRIGGTLTVFSTRDSLISRWLKCHDLPRSAEVCRGLPSLDRSKRSQRRQRSLSMVIRAGEDHESLARQQPASRLKNGIKGDHKQHSPPRPINNRAPRTEHFYWRLCQSPVDELVGFFVRTRRDNTPRDDCQQRLSTSRPTASLSIRRIRRDSPSPG